MSLIAWPEITDLNLKSNIASVVNVVGSLSLSDWQMPVIDPENSTVHFELQLMDGTNVTMDVPYKDADQYALIGRTTHILITTIETKQQTQQDEEIETHEQP